MTCTKCFSVTLGYSTGEMNQDGYLDCAHCGIAAERVALNDSMSKVNMIKQDEHFHAYQLGKAAAMVDAQLKMVQVLAAGMVMDMPELPIYNRSKQAIKIIQRMDSVEIPRVITPAEESELVSMLRKLWGHAIELGETDYFDDEQFEKEQYRQDCIEAAKLIAACK